ncbi:MAG: hypothetical protein LW626_00440, partial [Verrucomicrobium sp.]|nr:hypothetical protein [Verrucomicrobium sp.]
RIAGEVVLEIRKRLDFMVEVGLGYLTLDRESGSLSGGEAQRIRLATQIGAGLVGVLYILDEPSIGLHQRDNDRLLETLRRLRDAGNSVLVVEHDEDTIRAADHVLDLGPGAGVHGGELVAQGTPEAIMASARSVTGRYLSGDLSIPVPRHRVDPREDKGWIEILGATENNLRDVDARIPLGTLTCVTGVSGSGKSTLVDDILRRALFRQWYGSKAPRGRTRPPTPGCSTRSATSSPRWRRRACAATTRAASASTSRAGAARSAKATACSRSRCTSCRRCTSPARPVADGATTARPWRSPTRA